jgi:hypothetical protein
MENGDGVYYTHDENMLSKEKIRNVRTTSIRTMDDQQNSIRQHWMQASYRYSPHSSSSLPTGYLRSFKCETTANHRSLPFGKSRLIFLSFEFTQVHWLAISVPIELKGHGESSDNSSESICISMYQ